MVVLSALLFVTACSGGSEPPVFRLLTPQETGIDFANTISANDSFNVQTDAYIYNGAGTAVGDIDNDGLPDIFFSGNMVSSRLYLNKGSMKFQDITKSAGVSTTRWATGASMVDINGDGLLDIYVSVSGPGAEHSKANERANLLFVNNGNRTFTEEAARYGIADTGFTTHAAFLDYDRDGCLDLFLLNNSPKDFTRASHGTAVRDSTPGSVNQLYHNDCAGGKPGHFTNVSAKAGIVQPGFGLGVAIEDLNQDGWPDIYISNDIASNDVVYMNNGDGTFTNKRASWLKHTSYAGMGVDVADFNNDGWPDILQVDMLPRDLAQQKKMTGSTTVGGVTEALRRGLLVDFTTNTLQVSNGLTDGGEVLFSDIAQLAGVAATDWSWCPLFADFDNDGNKDILVTNGYPKAVNDHDYALAPIASTNPFVTLRKRSSREMLNNLYAYRVPNYVFRNRGDLTFADETSAWGMNQPSFSYGAAYVDLDNDGRLDVVVNNLNSPAFIYKNRGATQSVSHYLAIRLDGNLQNRNGIGTRVVLTAGGRKQYLYQSPFRGYLSTVDQRLHFGLGPLTRVDTLRIEWPDGRTQVLTNLSVDRLLTVRQSDAAPAKRAAEPQVLAARDRVFEPVRLRGLQYEQPVTTALDYSVQPLLPYVISRHGPVMAVADVNGDGLDDLFIGGGGGPAGKLFLQQSDGSFAESSRGQPWEADRAYEDWAAVFVDANGDGRPDLYVGSGGYRLAPSSNLLQDRLYLNVGRGKFVGDPQALPPMLASKGVVRVGDFNGDGRPDLFVSGRLTPRGYPWPTRSFILRNDGGHFTDVTEQVAPELVSPGGMITDATWMDFDGDGRLDLVTVGEWMPIQFFRNDGSRLRNVTDAAGLGPTRGWWFSITAADFDGDGRADIVAGNLGLNYAYQTSKQSPFGVYAGHFTGNGTTDIILTKTINGSEYPFEGLAPLGWQIYPLAVRYPTYGSFANAPMREVLSESERKQALHYEVDTFASEYFHNDGGGRFSARLLPKLAQVSPIKTMIARDFDGDGHLDVLVAGNMYDVEPNTPRADAGNGLWLRGNGSGQFTPLPPGHSGFLAPEDASSMALLRTKAGLVVAVANAADSLQFFKIKTH